LFLNVPTALSIANIKSPTEWLSKVYPHPVSESHKYSMTESLRPPVLNATTGVPPTKNSC
jgi:hypothetical protein